MKETAPVGSIQKFSIGDGPGIRTTVFLKGCPLNCRWCHNPELISFAPQLVQISNNCIGCGHCITACPENAISANVEKKIEVDRNTCTACMRCADACCSRALRPAAKEMSVHDIIEAVKQDKGFYDNTGGGMTISGGELLSRTGFTSALIDAAGEESISVCLDTSGYGKPDDLLNMAMKSNVTDILYDIKSFDDEIHTEMTGVSNKLIMDNLIALSKHDIILKKLTIRLPLVKGINDRKEDIEALGNFLLDLGICRVTLLPYHNLGISKMRSIGGFQDEFFPPDEKRLNEIKEYFKTALNFQVEILGIV